LQLYIDQVRSLSSHIQIACAAVASGINNGGSKRARLEGYDTSYAALRRAKSTWVSLDLPARAGHEDQQ